MPSLGADMDAGTITQWLVKPGDAVKRGDIVAVVETDKADVEVEIFEGGVLGEILVPEGEKVAVGTPLAIVRAAIAEQPRPPLPPEPVPQPEPVPPPEPVPLPEPVPAPEPVPPPEPPMPEPASHEVHSPVVRRLAAKLGVDLTRVTGTGPDGAVTRHDVETAAAPAKKRPRKRKPRKEIEAEARQRVSPRARRRARELGVDLEGVAGTGPAGAVTSADVEQGAAPVAQAAGPAPVPVPVPERRVAKAEAMRHAIGALLARSKREIPHYYLGTHVDMSRALTWLEAENGKVGVAERILPAAVVLRAVALAVGEVRDLNGFWVDDAFHPVDRVHLGVAISLREGGLIAPAIHDADRKDAHELMADLRDLVARARAGRLRSSEMSDPTITVTNLGDQGVETVYGVIYPPQVALVGVGKVVERPWARDAMVGVHPVIHLTLAADHRASDGHRGGSFLAAIDRRLQEPEKL